MIILYLFGTSTPNPVKPELGNEITLFIITEGTPGTLTLSVAVDFDIDRSAKRRSEPGETNKRTKENHVNSSGETFYQEYDDMHYANNPYSRKIIDEVDMNNLVEFEPKRIQNKIANTQHTRIVIIYNCSDDLTIEKLSRDMSRLLLFTFPYNKPIFFYTNSLKWFNHPIILQNIMLQTFLYKNFSTFL